MTPDELNKEIALLQGCKYEDGVWFDVEGRELDEAPDYAGDWRHCGPLLDEMTTMHHDGVRSWKDHSDNYHWFFIWKRIMGNGDTNTHAIAAAYCEWQKGKP